VGETLDLTFRIYRATLVKCLPLAALAMVVSQLPSLYLLLSGRGLNVQFLTLVREPTYQAIYVVSVLLAAVLNAAILLRQHRLVTAQQPGGELGAALRRAPALVLWAVLFWLALVACLVPVMLFPGAARVAGFVLAGLLLCYLVVALSCGFVLVVVERAGPIASLTRSWNLTRGSFWRLTLIYTVALVILTVLYILLGTATGFVVAVVAHGELAVVTAAYAVVVVALGALVVPFYMAVQLAVFGDLTARREGTDLAQRISAAA